MSTKQHSAALIAALRYQRDQQESMFFSAEVKVREAAGTLRAALEQRDAAAGLARLFTDQLGEIDPEGPEAHAQRDEVVQASHRALTLAAWREFVEFLEDNPELPLPKPYRSLYANTDDLTAEAGRAALEAAEIRGMEVDGYSGIKWSKTFGDHAITYKIDGKFSWLPDDEDPPAKERYEVVYYAEDEASPWHILDNATGLLVADAPDELHDARPIGYPTEDAATVAATVLRAAAQETYADDDEAGGAELL